MSTIEEKQIAKEILIELIKKDLLSYDGYEGAKNFVDLSLCSYQDILKAVSDSK